MIFLVHTLGCKVNHFESFQIAEALKRLGWQESKDSENKDPDVVIVNTCAVTSRASYQSRQAFRKLKKRFTNAKIIITGCDATYEGNIYKEEGAHEVIPQKDKEKILKILLGEESELPYPPRMPGRSRAYLKVEDGCEGSCSYCVIPKLRGKVRSVPMEKVKEALIKLFDMGYKEVVLVGINLGSYGKDIYGKPRLVELVELLLKRMDKEGRLRLSSIEPDLFPMEIVEMMDGEKLCRHAHIPLQGTTDRILRKMGRKYTLREFERIISKIKVKSDLITIGTDIIVGYPGEDHETFKSGVENLLGMCIDYGHVFPYSKRRGTTSPGAVDREARERARILRKLLEKKRLEHMKGCVSKTFTVVVEKNSMGMTDNYIKVKLTSEEEEGSLKKVLIKELLENSCLLGVVI